MPVSSSDLRNTFIAALAIFIKTPVPELQGLTLTQLLHRGQLAVSGSTGAAVRPDSGAGGCAGQLPPEPEAIQLLLQFRDEEGVDVANELARLCADEVRNALVDEVHSRVGTSVARLQALATSELMERARYAYSQGMLAQKS